MNTSEALNSQLQTMSDDEIIHTVLNGRIENFEVIMRRYNSKLYRLCRSLVTDADEARDIVQETYYRAYVHLADFENRSKFSTWLFRIAFHEALARMKKQKKMTAIDTEPEITKIMVEKNTQEKILIHQEQTKLLEQALDRLPLMYKCVLVLRDIEEHSTKQTAEFLEISNKAVKTRLHRARALLRAELYDALAKHKKGVYQLHLMYCDSIVFTVLSRIKNLSTHRFPPS